MWIDLTPGLLLSRVSAPEKEALATAAADPEQTGALEDTAAMVASDWRAGLRRVCAPDRRTPRVPDELLIHILADFRYRAYTRLPGMESLLDDRRVKEWERAMDVRDSLAKWTVAPPEEGWAEGAESGSPGKPGPLVRDPDADSVLG
jgi:hypothetical protein